MHWLIFSSEQNRIVKQCNDLLEVSGQIVIHENYHEKSSFKEIDEKIQKHKPDRIIVITNDKTVENNTFFPNTLIDELLIPLYIAQATINRHASTRVLILTFINQKDLLDPISTINIVQNATNQLINIYPHVINARIISPIKDEELNEESLLTIFQSYCSSNPEETHHVSILSDILPILLALIHDGKAHGQINACNKGTISLQWFKQYISNQSKKAIDAPPLIDNENLTDDFEKWNKQMISPETRHLYQASFALPTISKSIEQYLQQKSIHLNSDSTKNLFVTGGCGFIGSTFINHWLKTYPNDRIVNIDRLDSVANMKNIENPDSPNYSLIVADIQNKDIVLHLMQQYNITHIVHFAVQAHLDTSFGNSITFTESNVYGTHSVLEAARIYGKIQKFIHLSTDEVYGETPDGSFQETNLLNPLNPYAATIAAAEFLVKSYGESFKLSFSIIRLSSVYGPRQHYEKVIPSFMNNLFHNEKLQIHGDGKQIRYYLYVDDIVNAIDIIFNKGKTKMIYNIGPDNGITVLDIAKKLLELIQSDKQLEDVIVYGKARSFQEKRYSSTTSGAAKTLGWKAQVSFDEGLEKTIQWYKQNPDYWT